MNKCALKNTGINLLSIIGGFIAIMGVMSVWGSIFNYVGNTYYQELLYGQYITVDWEGAFFAVFIFPIIIGLILFAIYGSYLEEVKKCEKVGKGWRTLRAKNWRSK